VHYNVGSKEDDLFYSTWADEGGSGQPLVFVLCKGWRAPRAWELALLGGYQVLLSVGCSTAVATQLLEVLWCYRVLPR
jgi:hypothetical protein